MDQPSGNNRQFFRQVQKGDIPSASEHNKITSAVSGLMSRPNVHPHHYSKIRLIKTSEVMGPFLHGDTAAEIDREFSFRYFGGAAFADGSREPLENLCDPFELVYDAGEYLLAVYSEQHAKFYPINPRTVRHAITCRDASNRYPKRSEYPDTYPIKWVQITYAEAGGAMGHTIAFLNPPTAGAGEDDFVHNIADRFVSESYIPEGTVIECYNVTRQWFCEFSQPIEDSSQSASESSLSSSSQSGGAEESSSSESSQSISSVSSASSASSPSSLSSASSQSSSSSSRGSSGSSASSSSLSSSSSSGDNAYAIHRGLTNGAISKGATGQVSRYTDGTDSDSGIDDSVKNDFANVGSGKIVAYAKIGSNFYMISAEC